MKNKKMNSKYHPHQGKQEMARRVKQMKNIPTPHLRKIMLNEEQVQKIEGLKVLEQSLDVFECFKDCK